MSTASIDTIECPGCSIQFKVRRPAGAAIVVCPRCRQEVELVVSDNQLAMPKQRDVFDQLPLPLQYSEQVLPPRKRFLKPFVRAVAARKRVWLALLAIFLSSAVMVGVGYGVYSKREQLKEGLVKSVLPREELPTEIVVDHEAMATSLVVLVGSIHDVNARNKATNDLRQFIRGYQRLSARAIALGPLSEHEFESLSGVFEIELPRRTEQVKEACAKLLRDRSLAGSVFQSLLAEIMTEETDFSLTLQRAWSPVPAPQTEAERRCHQMKLVRRRVWGAVMSVENESDFEELESVVGDAATELESMLVKRFAARQSGELVDEAEASAKYADDLLVQTQTQFGKLKSAFGNLGDGRPFQRYVDAATALNNVHSQAD